MAKYTEHFHLHPNELDLIETALRREIASLSDHTTGEVSRSRVREINQLLGKLFHQKTFYAQVHSTGIPAG